MRGTDKQIAWAEDIKAKVIDTMEQCRSFFISCAEYDETNPAHVAVAEKFAKNVQAIESEEYAGDIIEMFSGVRADDFMKAYSEFRSALHLCGNPHIKYYAE